MTTAVGAPNHNGPDPRAPEPENVYDRIAAAINDVPGEIARLDAERRRVAQLYQDRIDVLIQERQAAVAGLDEHRTQLNKLLKAMGHEPIAVEVENPRRGRKAKRGAERKMSAEKALKICEGILAQGNDLFTAIGIHEGVNANWISTSTNSLFAYLREREIIGFVRREPRKYGRDLYRLLDRDKGVQWKEELEAEIAEKAKR